MRRIIAGILFLVPVLCLCTSCGGEHDILEYELVENGSTASGSAINASGSAVNVSGSAVEDTKNSGQFSINKKSPFCNDSNYYEEDYSDSDTPIRQMKLDGTFVRTILKGKYASLIYVTNDELFYSWYKNDEDGNGEIMELFRVPIRKTENGDELIEEEAEFVLEAEGSFQIAFYADENYIVYITNYYDFRVFDRKAGKHIKLKGNPSDKKGMANSCAYIADSMCGDHIIFTCKYSGLYMYTLGSDQVVLVDDKVHGAYSSVAYDNGDGGQIIYERCETRKSVDDEKEEEHELAFYVYDCKTGDKKKFMTRDEWRSVYAENGILEEAKQYWKEDWDNGTAGELFIDGDTLYIVEGYFVFRFELKDGKGPYFEKDMSEWMRKQDYGEWDILGFDNGKCYLENEGDDDDEDSPVIEIVYDVQSKTYVEKEKKY